MAKRRKKQKRHSQLYAFFVVIASLIFSAAILITLKDQGGVDFPFFVPSWSQVYEYLGLEESAPAMVSEGELSVRMIDTGQSDAIYIHAPEADILIDAGEVGEGQKVVSYLEAQGVEKLDLVVATHPHSDHIGGMAEVLSAFEVDVFTMPRLPDSMVPTTQVYEGLLDAVRENSLKIRAAEPGKTYDFGDAHLALLAPLEDYDDLNNYSAVVRLVYGETSFLFTGDAEEQSEEAMLSSGETLQADVLKVGHHGSSTSSSESFLDTVSPEIALIACGEGNDYGHPHDETIERLAQHGCEVYRTDLDGTIVVASDGNKLSVYTQNER